MQYLKIIENRVSHEIELSFESNDKTDKSNLNQR